MCYGQEDKPWKHMASLTARLKFVMEVGFKMHFNVKYTLPNCIKVLDMTGILIIALL